ncbi:treslin-like isoform X3 [Eriocheir sinensis]|uniref:treslin-like isoform X3 n=1 Tax=Eriocheir sinensis TaxID=95602 RepID=UPI0021C8AF62|nr:treslin-like isoform X3 [Eriocheir sinensis]
MYSTVQAVLVLDLNNFMGLCSSESEIEQHVAKIKLVSLKLLLDFGAKTDRAVNGVRWSWKFYNSRTFKPDTSRKQFLDFGKKAFGEFESELTDKYCKTFDSQEEGEPPLECRRPHSFVLKKALQEVLLDYNWDGPDISSPVKTARRRTYGGASAVPPSSGPYNAIIVVANVPRGPEAPAVGLQGDFLVEVLDGAMVKAFQEDKKISLSFVEVQKAPDGPQTTKLNADLVKLNGSLHNITDFVQTQPRQVASLHRSSSAEAESVQHVAPVSSQQVQLPWRSGRPSRSRKPQPGPVLVWEDAAGISHLSMQLQVLAVYGSCSRAWSSASVVGALYTSQMALLALAQDTASLYVCVANCDTFGALITVLATHQLSLVLRLSCGSLALLSPWGGGAGCLALVSASGLAALAPYMPDCPPSTLQFVSAAVRRCLKDAAPCPVEEAAPSKRWFAVSMTQHWFRPVPSFTLPTPRTKNRLATARQRKMMLERLQKRYRPQILQPLAAGETGPLDLVDITQPPVEPQQPQATLAKPNMTRAQQLLKKSHIVTAQQKVKEQRAEEEERVQATERRAAQASERALKSQALETQVLNTVSDPQDERKLVESLVSLRETAGVEADIFTTAQTIINVALVHVKNTTVTPTPAAATMQEGLGRVLGCGVLQSAADILSRPQPDTHLHQYKLQTLLHLEMLWVLGYSASSKQSEEEEVDEEMSERKEYHVEEVVRLLRAISLHHDPSTMANFLQEIVLENYLETLGEVLLEVYEELNQPLPAPLRDLAGDIHSVQSNWPPASVRSQGTPTQYSESPAGSGENPGSGRSKEGRRLRMRPNPSLHEANKRSIVVPKVTRALSRTHSEQPRTCSGQSGLAANGTATAESSAAPVKKVRRNLFEPGEGSQTSPKNKLKRCLTQPTSKKTSVAASKSQQPAHPSPIKTKFNTPRSKKGQWVHVLAYLGCSGSLPIQ